MIISSSEIIPGLIKRIKQQKKGYLTNFFFDAAKLELWINLRLLEYEEIGNTIFIFRKKAGFYNLFFISTDIQTLSKDINLLENRANDTLYLVDLIGQSTCVTELRKAFEKNGYFDYVSLLRMSKTTNKDQVERGFDHIFDADRSKGELVNLLLQKYFDPYAEQLPLIEEINKWIENNGILLYSDDSEIIQGFLIYELIGQTSYLRYWFVHPDHREKKIGSALLQKFLNLSKDSKRQLFWVIQTNNNAIKRYEHYGFKKEELFDQIMSNKNICYEG